MAADERRRMSSGDSFGTDGSVRAEAEGAEDAEGSTEAEGTTNGESTRSGEPIGTGMLVGLSVSWRRRLRRGGDGGGER